MNSLARILVSSTQNVVVYFSNRTYTSSLLQFLIIIFIYSLSYLWLFKVCPFLKSKSTERTWLYRFFLDCFISHAINSLFLKQPFILFFFHFFCSLFFTITRTTFSVNIRGLLYMCFFLFFFFFFNLFSIWLHSKGSDVAITNYTNLTARTVQEP